MEKTFSKRPARPVTGVYSRAVVLPGRRNCKREIETLLEMVPANDSVLFQIVSLLEEHLAAGASDCSDDEEPVSFS